MKFFLSRLLLALLPAQAQVGSIALYYEFQSHPPQDILSTIQREVSTLMSPAGFRFQWKALPSSGKDVTTEIAVLTFRGQCDAASLLNTTFQSNRLGWTIINDGEVLPYAVIDCDNIRGFIYKKLRGLPQIDQNTAMGRAVARVLVHELGHVFAESATHGSREVDQPSYTVDELTTDHLSMADPKTHILRLGAPPAGTMTGGKAIFAHSGCSTCHGANGEGSRSGPVLRIAGRLLDTVKLAAQLARKEDKMCQRAHSLNIPPPSLSEGDLSEIVTFLHQ